MAKSSRISMAGCLSAMLRRDGGSIAEHRGAELLTVSVCLTG